ncbi:MAG TPA: tRNA (adenosine(37)-N6)-threonylcarbamoyltransferase complex transferase subunit TsaD, partial [Candidatus Kapabacteria bacterium]|nr:tRNA (adenosine(37)-N6)-threonylcarbamoyltransferase complex transferase subunit TsaD [Candidatus Kapabacteria bacterium]
MKILAFESSCDETSVSIVENGQIRSNIISSQYFHKKYGGVVPELASRAHLEAICELTEIAFEQAMLSPQDIDAIAV